MFCYMFLFQTYACAIKRGATWRHISSGLCFWCWGPIAVSTHCWQWARRPSASLLHGAVPHHHRGSSHLSPRALSLSLTFFCSRVDGLNRCDSASKIQIRLGIWIRFCSFKIGRFWSSTLPSLFTPLVSWKIEVIFLETQYKYRYSYMYEHSPLWTHAHTPYPYEHIRKTHGTSRARGSCFRQHRISEYDMSASSC
jgi:hypothetical protein